jgi:CDK inhibitor PHO81
MKFGKYIASIASQWAEPYYLNYKGLKKIISSDKNNITFFFTLERELEKVNSFYLQKEKELKIRCENLLKILNFPNSASQHILKEYVIQFQADLANLQNFVSVNAMGFSKILKKFDKHRKAVTKEIYLSSKVDVQPCFNNEVLASLSDSAAQMLADLESIFLSTNPEFDSDCSKFLLEKNHTALKTALVQNPQNRSVLSNLFLLHCSGTSLECLKVLLETGNVDICSYRDSLSLRNSLFDVVNTGNVEKLKLLLEYKADPNQSDLYGKTTLHYAAMNGFTKCVKVLIGNCEINALDFDGKTPLLEAIYGGHTDTVRLLLENSADPEPQENCINALSLACDNGHFEIVSLLLKRNVPMKRNSQGLFPLHLSAKNGHLEITKMLIEFGVDVNAKDLFYGWTPAFFTVQEGHVSILSLLIDAGADINSADSEGWYPLTYALYHGHLDIANILTAKSERHPHKDMSTAYNLKEKNNAAAIDSMELEDIPALTLPPPVMPLRI